MLCSPVYRFALAVSGQDWNRPWEQDKPEAWKMPENRGESHLSAARFVSSSKEFENRSNASRGQIRNEDQYQLLFS
jgi:hypothetical protein